MIGEGFTEVKGEIQEVKKQLARIEATILTDHEKRIQRIEDALYIRKPTT